MLKILQGGIRMSMEYDSGDANVANMVAGAGVIVQADATGVIVPTSVSGLPPVGLLFDTASTDAGSVLSTTGGGGGSVTLMESTGNTRPDVTVIGGAFVGQTDYFVSGIDEGSLLMVQATTGKLTVATGTGAFIVGQAVELIGNTEVKFIFNSAGARVTA